MPINSITGTQTGTHESSIQNTLDISSSSKMRNIGSSATTLPSSNNVQSSDLRDSNESYCVSLFGFQGNGKDDEIGRGMHPYEVTGHVGYSLDGGKHIYGYGPMKEHSSEKILPRLLKGELFTAQLTDDTHVFIKVAKSHNITSDFMPQLVYKRDIEVSPQEYKRIQNLHESFGVNTAIPDAKYGFPVAASKRTPNEQRYNCATFPGKLGVPLPETTGRIQTFVPALMEDAEVWRP